MQRTLIILAALLLATPVGATEVLLRNRVVATGSVVLLGDIAEIKSESESLRSELAALPLVPSPAEGTQQYLRMAEIRDLVAARGLDLRGIRFGGTAVVSIAPEAVAQPAAVEQKRIPVARPVVRTQEEIELAAERLTSTIRTHLQAQTGHELWTGRVEADAKLVDAVEKAGADVRLSGGEPPWVGRQRFSIVGPSNQPIALVYAKVDRLEMAVFALQPIKRGDLIRRTDVELRPHLGALPSQAVLSLDAVVGCESIQGIRPDSIVQSNQVRSPVVVRRNERVSVRARAAGVSVRTYAIAQQDGSIGDLVMVQSVASKDRYAARVTGLRELEIFTAGASAAEIAANPVAAQ